MAKSSSRKSGAFWRADWFAGVAVLVLATILFQTNDFLYSLELRFYDFASTSTSRQPSDRVAIINIDDQSIAKLGRWPWSRDIHAHLIDKLRQANVKTIVFSSFLFEPQTDPGLNYIQKIRETVAANPDAAVAYPQLTGLIAAAEQSLDTDTVLAASLQKAGNVLLPTLLDIGAQQGRPDKPLPEFAAKSTVEETRGFSVAANRFQMPIEILGQAAAGVGHLNPAQDRDGAIRSEMLLVNYSGQAVPSLALLAAEKSLNLTAQDLQLNPGESVQLGKIKIKTDTQAVMRPQFYQGRNGKPPFASDSFDDVLSGKIPASNYAGKVVIIGAPAAGVGTLFKVPGHSNLTPAESMAHVISSLLNAHFIVQPAWAGLALVAALFVVAAYVIAALPRLSAGMGAAVTAGLFVSLLAIEFGLLSVAAIWIQLVLPATALLLGYLALTTKRLLVTGAGRVKPDEGSAETNRMMGLALQGQGQLDMAFERFRRVPLGEAVMGNLYSLALDFERQRQFNMADAVYAHMAVFDTNYKDVKAKLSRATNLSETVIRSGAGSQSGGTLPLDGGGVEKPTLGRYQIEKELGKGAMGVVYLGKDPKIGRVVAIKTLALGEEFAGEELADARARFFREAETAGRLQHQNIVTIFDAGEEHDLAYIAMEFLKGRDLVEYCKGDTLLPVPTVLSIVARVAEALAYAHQQNVVHRDIKPANIMYELASDTVKVTDFGIARITDSSKTRTGLVLGTPSFMSPEQLAGKKVDGRSDLYSLGVMLFQMLAGVLPFRGDSMAALMFKIANDEAPDIRVIRPELPLRLADIVALSLSKRPETRYQDGHQFAADLRGALAQIAGNAPANPDGTKFADNVPREKTMAFVAPVVKPVAEFDKTVIQPSHKTNKPNLDTGTDLDL